MPNMTRRTTIYPAIITEVKMNSSGNASYKIRMEHESKEKTKMYHEGVDGVVRIGIPSEDQLEKAAKSKEKVLAYRAKERFSRLAIGKIEDRGDNGQWKVVFGDDHQSYLANPEEIVLFDTIGTGHLQLRRGTRVLAWNPERKAYVGGIILGDTKAIRRLLPNPEETKFKVIHTLNTKLEFHYSIGKPGEAVVDPGEPPKELQIGQDVLVLKPLEGNWVSYFPAVVVGQEAEQYQIKFLKDDGDQGETQVVAVQQIRAFEHESSLQIEPAQPDLDVEVPFYDIQELFRHLDVQSLCRLSATCVGLYRLIRLNENLWQFLSHRDFGYHREHVKNLKSCFPEYASRINWHTIYKNEAITHRNTKTRLPDTYYWHVIGGSIRDYHIIPASQKSISCSVVYHIWNYSAGPGVIHQICASVGIFNEKIRPKDQSEVACIVDTIPPVKDNRAYTTNIALPIPSHLHPGIHPICVRRELQYGFYNAWKYQVSNWNCTIGWVEITPD